MSLGLSRNTKCVLGSGWKNKPFSLFNGSGGVNLSKKASEKMRESLEGQLSPEHVLGQGRQPGKGRDTYRNLEAWNPWH